MILENFDAFGKLPKHLEGKFDIIHVRAFTIVVKGGHPGTLLDNIIAMLKPGGYLQWDEMDSASFRAHVPNEITPKRNMESILERLQHVCKKSDLDFGEVIYPNFLIPSKRMTDKTSLVYIRWISNLAEICSQKGFKVIDSFRLPCSDGLRHMSTDNFLMGLEDLGYVVSEKALG